jgi:hypothetical protein
MGLYVPGDALSGFLVSLLGFLAGQDARDSTVTRRYPMYKEVEEQPRTGQKNNLDITYTVYSITQRKGCPSPMLRPGLR